MAVDPAGLAASVRAVFVSAASYVSLVTLNNPYRSSAALVERPDVEAVLRAAFEEARQLASQAVLEAWSESAPSDEALLNELLGDVDRAYNEESLAHLRGVIRHAYSSVPLQHFTPGVSEPGSHPVQEAVDRRAQAVQDAVESYGSRLGLRNSLSADVAYGTSRTLAQLESAADGALKRWRTSRQPPDDRTCYWCRKLNGVTIPVGQSFEGHLGGPVDIAGHGHLTRPPQPYRGWLQGPRLHPNCRCHLEIVSAGTVSPSAGGGQEPSVAPGYLSAAEIRAMPEQRYRQLTEFMRAATHELGQVLYRLGRWVRG